MQLRLSVCARGAVTRVTEDFSHETWRFRSCASRAARDAAISIWTGFRASALKKERWFA
jgi:hypothetical protein